MIHRWYYSENVKKMQNYHFDLNQYNRIRKAIEDI